MADLKYYDVILRPVVTEKSMNMMAEKKYAFYVHPEANKAQIKEAVQRMFDGTKVKAVKTMNLPRQDKEKGHGLRKDCGQEESLCLPHRGQQRDRDLLGALIPGQEYTHRKRDNKQKEINRYGY